jgi:hypothetical protein
MSLLQNWLFGDPVSKSGILKKSQILVFRGVSQYFDLKRFQNPVGFGTASSIKF